MLQRLIAWALRWHLLGLWCLWWVLILGLPMYALQLAAMGLALSLQQPWAVTLLYIDAANTHRLPWGLGIGLACAATWAATVWLWWLSPQEKWRRAVDLEAVAWQRAVTGAGLSPVNRLTRITINAGNTHGVLAASRSLAAPGRDLHETVARLAPVIASHYPRHGRHGHVEHIRATPADHDRARRVKISVIRQVLHTPPPVTLVGPARPNELYLGESHRGPLWWDLRDQAHALIAAATRMGKGVLARALATQALLAGWKVVVLDATGSREWAACATHPGFVWQPADDPKAWYRWANEIVADLASHMRQRNAAIGDAGYDNWQHAHDAGVHLGPRVLLILDETTATLGVNKDSPLAKPAQQLANHIDTAVRSWAKAGGHVIVIDQAPYQGLTGLSQATRNQLERYVGIGPMSTIQQQMVGGCQDWPHVSGEKGHGCTGRRGAAPDEVRVPNAERDVIEASLAQAVSR